MKARAPKSIKEYYDSQKLIRLLGGGKRKSLTGMVRRKVENFLEELPDYVRPKVVRQAFDITDRGKGSVTLEGDVTFRSVKLSRALKIAREAVCFAATLGPGIDAEINALMADNRYSDAYILDAMGSVIIEGVVDQFQNRIEQTEALADKSVTLRFSPGYCDWALKEQEKLFALLDTEKIGVALSDSFLMAPRKSVSGIFGVSAPGVACDSLPHNPCRQCSQKNCIARRP